VVPQRAKGRRRVKRGENKGVGHIMIVQGNEMVDEVRAVDSDCSSSSLKKCLASISKLKRLSRISPYDQI
jgi:hypothetical protein